jgi:type III secretion system YscQ/HrcQ family protein
MRCLTMISRLGTPLRFCRFFAEQRLYAADMSNSQHRFGAASLPKDPTRRLAGRMRRVDGQKARLLQDLRKAARLRWLAGQGIEVASASPLTNATTELVATIVTTAGTMTLGFPADQWPGLASAATLSDDEERRAIALLLIGQQALAIREFIVDVDLRYSTSLTPTERGIGLRLDGKSFYLLSVSQDMLEATDVALKRLPPAPSPVAHALSLPCRMVVGSRTMSAGALRKLFVGDTILLAPMAGTSVLECVAICVWGAFDLANIQARVLVRHHIMTLLETPSLKQPVGLEHRLDAPIQDPPAGIPGALANLRASESAAPIDLDVLEFNVQFELPGPLLALAAIANLASGDVLELAMPVDHARVRIMVAQQCIGLGELVVLGDRLGVQVMRIQIGHLDNSQVLAA